MRDVEDAVAVKGVRLVTLLVQSDEVPQEQARTPETKLLCPVTCACFLACSKTILCALFGPSQFLLRKQGNHIANLSLLTYAIKSGEVGVVCCQRKHHLT